MQQRGGTAHPFAGLAQGDLPHPDPRTAGGTSDQLTNFCLKSEDIEDGTVDESLQRANTLSCERTI